MCENMFVFKVIDPKNALECGLFILMQAHWGKKEVLERSALFHGYTFIIADLSRTYSWFCWSSVCRFSNGYSDNVPATQLRDR